MNEPFIIPQLTSMAVLRRKFNADRQRCSGPGGQTSGAGRLPAVWTTLTAVTACWTVLADSRQQCHAAGRRDRPSGRPSMTRADNEFFLPFFMNNQLCQNAGDGH